jgi:protein gp37
MATQICWTNETWNPVTGCTPVSEACHNCYAAALHNRRHKAYLEGKKVPVQYARPFEELQFLEKRLEYPYRWRKPRMIFVNSMGDLFHEHVPDDFVNRVFRVMTECSHHIFQVLTKRPERAARWPGPWPLNVWLGTTVETARHLDRLDHLRASGASTRFVSFEPLLGPLGDPDLSGIHWAIVGGETGSGRRPFEDAWARELRDRCVAAGVAFFFKQHAGTAPRTAPWLVEEDGSRWEWKQYPGRLEPPVPIDR